MQDVNEYYSLKYPKLYTPGHLDLFFNKLVFGESVCEGIFMSAIIFFVTYGTYHSAATPTGLDLSDYHSFGFVVASILIVAVTLRVRSKLKVISRIGEGLTLNCLPYCILLRKIVI
jgi:phospholipid-translocating ATPase